MAKWKNALLISTIVAPIAFGAGPIGDALASATKPSKTNVTLHKYVTTDQTDYNNTSYWGNGLETSNPFGSDTSWEAANKAVFGFTAYKLPDSAIKGLDSNGEPIIGSAWKDLIGAEAVTADDYKTGLATNVDKAGISQYIITVKDEAALKAKLVALGAAATPQVAYTTNDSLATGTPDGTAEFTDLANGNWVIFETSQPDSITASDVADPMVLMLPMANAYSEDGDTTGKWFGNSANRSDALHLYPKNLSGTGDLKVAKKDPEDDTKKLAASFGMMEISDADNVTLIKQALVGKYTDKSGTEHTKSIYDEYKTVDARVAALEALGASFTGTGTSAKYLTSSTTGTDAGTVEFTGLVPFHDYYVLELGAPEGYMVNGTLQKVVLNETPGDTSIDGDTIYYTGQRYTVDDYNEPVFGKDINVGTPNDLTTGETEGFVDDDTTKVVARGQIFQYKLTSELNADLENYTKYTITDTVPYQVNINEFMMGLQLEGGDYQPLIKVDSQSADTSDDNGGDTGHGYYYDTDADNVGGDGKENTPFSVADAAKFSFADEDAKTWFATYVGVIDGIDPNSESLTDEDVQKYISGLIQVSGQTSVYSFTENNRALEPGATPGTLVINLKTTLLDALGDSDVIADGSDADWVTIMNAQANAAAQTGEINNTGTIDFNNGYETDTKTDSAKTFDAGWEFVKQGSNGQPLAGAGFDLARVLYNSDAVTNVKDNVLQGTNLGTQVTDANAVEMADKLIEDNNWFGNATGGTSGTGDALYLAEEALKGDFNADGSRKANVTDSTVATHLRAVLDAQESAIAQGDKVYFAHLTLDSSKQPVLSMMGTTAKMGDIFWTLYPALATTHTTNVEDGQTVDGYLQYCGLPAGRYELIESVVPEGYSAAAAQKFALGSADSTGVEGDGYNYLKGTLDTVAVPSDSDGITGDVTGDHINIVNYEKSIFPLVGGLGTLFAVIAGLLAMGLALLKRKKDMKNEA
ncbi:SpaA isopeptide-forming pilin-related protein [Weissella confusa]|uniref:SpaA isopeptide-forming pilin-related protein n=1 Tax=Weissella confusa TaxID=1583 RepID=UPI0022E97FD2|nr:pilin N-terminal domain-containing protein [Weissella confusa]